MEIITIYTGAYSASLISAILGQADIAQAARSLIDLWNAS